MRSAAVNNELPQVSFAFAFLSYLLIYLFIFLFVVFINLVASLLERGWFGLVVTALVVSTMSSYIKSG